MNKNEIRRVASMQRACNKAELAADEINRYYTEIVVYCEQKVKEITKYTANADGKRRLTDKELAIILMLATDPADVFSVVNTIETVPGIDDEIRKLYMSGDLPLAMREIARLQREIDELAGNARQAADTVCRNHITDIIRSSYYREIYELQLRAGISFPFTKVTTEYIARLTRQDWAGDNYVNRLFHNTRNFAETLKTEIIKGAITGKTEWEIMKALQEKAMMSESKMRRIVRTETVYFYTQADMKARKECGIKKYMFLATLDKRTSAICRSLDGNIYYVDKQKPGYNCPPMHPWCRSTTLSIISKDWIKKQTRSALDIRSGKKVKVPLSMTYGQWYRKFVLEATE